MLQSIDKTFELKLQASNIAPAGSEFQLSAPSTTFQTFLGTSSVRLGSLDLEACGYKSVSEPAPFPFTMGSTECACHVPCHCGQMLNKKTMKVRAASFGSVFMGL